MASAPERRAQERMREALALARETPVGDVPVAALVYSAEGRVVGRGVNRREANCDPTAHAEVEAIRDAARTLGSWRLDGCELVVTLEPCTMCAGAILGARVSSLVFGAWEPKTGAVGSVLDAVREPRHLHVPEVRAGVLEPECADLMADFFAGLRVHSADTRPVEGIGQMNEGDIMALEGKGDQLKGQAKEAFGEVTGDESIKNEGKADNLIGNVKEKLADAGDAIKDKANEVAAKVEDKRDEVEAENNREV